MTDQELKFRLDDILVWGFAFWPLFWSVWGVIRVPYGIMGYSITSLVLIALTGLAVFFHPKLPLLPLVIWMCFPAVIVLENYRGMTAQCKRDLMVMICGVLFCMAMQQQEYNKRMLLRCLLWCGIIIALSVILDSATHILRFNRLRFYTPSAAYIKLNTRATAGLLVFTGTAGGFIYTGLGAWLALLKLHEGYVSKVVKWGVIGCFAMSAVLILKRGFIIDFAAAAVFLLLIQLRKEDLEKLNITRLIRGIFGMLIIAAAFIAAYLALPAVQGPVDALIERFSGSDGSMANLSGRTDLYEVAINLFKQNKLTGVGWGRFRSYTLGFYNVSDNISFATHNVYLQLLCETGILGFAAFIAATGSALVWGVKRYRRLLRSDPGGTDRWAGAIGIYLQVFFLAYCMSGNPLYDYNFLITYFIGIVLTLGLCSKEKQEKTDKENDTIENRYSYIL